MEKNINCGNVFVLCGGSNHCFLIILAINVSNTPITILRNKIPTISKRKVCGWFSLNLCNDNIVKVFIVLEEYVTVVSIVSHVF